MKRVAQESFGPTAEKVVGNANFDALCPFVGIWKDIDLCWFAIYPFILDNGSDSVDLKEEILVLVKREFEKKRENRGSFSHLAKDPKAAEFLSMTVTELLRSSPEVNRCIGVESFCNIVFVRMSKMIALGSDQTAELVADLMPEDIRWESSSVSKLSSQDMSLLVDYNHLSFFDISDKYSIPVSEAHTRVLHLIDKIRNEP